jgi:hypothetical protein
MAFLLHINHIEITITTGSLQVLESHARGKVIFILYINTQIIFK